MITIPNVDKKMHYALIFIITAIIAGYNIIPNARFQISDNQSIQYYIDNAHQALSIYSHDNPSVEGLVDFDQLPFPGVFVKRKDIQFYLSPNGSYIVVPEPSPGLAKYLANHYLDRRGFKDENDAIVQLAWYLVGYNDDGCLKTILTDTFYRSECRPLPSSIPDKALVITDVSM